MQELAPSPHHIPSLLCLRPDIDIERGENTTQKRARRGTRDTHKRGRPSEQIRFSHPTLSVSFSPHRSASPRTAISWRPTLRSTATRATLWTARWASSSGPSTTPTGATTVPTCTSSGASSRPARRWREPSEFDVVWALGVAWFTASFHPVRRPTTRPLPHHPPSSLPFPHSLGSLPTDAPRQQHCLPRLWRA